MPNWCSNTLMLNEDSNDSILVVLKDYLNQDGHLSFEKIRPIPDELKNMQSPPPKDLDENVRKELINKYGADNWWDWCVMNWGTKWDCDVYHSDEKAIGFSTAWSPPMGIVKTLAILTGKDFRLTYIEEGMDFCGEFFAYKNWLENLDCEYSIKDAPEALKEELGVEEWDEDEDNE
jgi:hypothetical protein